MKRMWSLYTVLVLVAPISFMSFQEASGCNRRIWSQDSLVIAQSQHRIVVNENTPTASVQLKFIQHRTVSESKQLCLLLTGIQLKQPPEGVYEIYISPVGANPDKLKAEGPYFVDVLNTYSMASSGKTEQLCLDVTHQFLKKEDRNKQLNYTVTIRFQGNLLPDNTSSLNAGRLTIDTIQLVQTNISQ